jgi:PPP family 3-phenylpropionic acid transporter
MKKMGWSFTFYFLYFAALAFMAPFIVLYYRQLNFSGAQIGLLAGLPALVTMVANPLLSGIADRSRRHNLILGLGIFSAAAIIAALPWFHGFIAVFLLIITFNFLFSPVASLGDAATMAMLGEERGLYGRVRLGGTLGWGIFALLAGKLLEARGVVFLMYVFSAILLVNLFVSLKLSFGHHDEHATQSGGVKTLLQNRRLVIFLASAFLGGLGAFSVAVYLAPYLTDLNASGDQIGFALAVATIPELAVFFFGNALVKRFTARGLFVIALALMGVRSILFGMVDNLTLAIAIQILGGAIFPAMWLAGVAYADEHAPSNLKSTAQGLFGAMSFGFGSAFGGFAGGLLLDRMGTRGMFLVFGIIIIAGLALTEGLRRILPDEAPLRA